MPVYESLISLGVKDLGVLVVFGVIVVVVLWFPGKVPPWVTGKMLFWVSDVSMFTILFPYSLRHEP